MNDKEKRACFVFTIVCFRMRDSFGLI